MRIQDSALFAEKGKPSEMVFVEQKVIHLLLLVGVNRVTL
jgi:hypothetical protein